MKEGPVRAKRAKARARAQALLQSLPMVQGFKPKPCALKFEQDEEDDALNVSAYKNVECEAYDLCVRIASIANWDDLSCRACPVYRKQETRSRLVRRIKQRVIRFIRKVRGEQDEK